jgi:hypothetical protein
MPRNAALAYRTTGRNYSIEADATVELTQTKLTTSRLTSPQYR